jgi:outer membrane protein OmpA-like peptidoglycan-associated protein/tetratricopeptide (TPR) repeat protein
MDIPSDSKTYKNIQMKIALRLFLLTLIIFSSTDSFASGPRKDLRKARRYFNSSKYIKAKDKYLALLKTDSLNRIYNYELALTYFNMDNIKVQAVPFFERSLQNANGNIIGEAYFFLGICYHLQAKYADAISSFEKYKNEVNTNGTYVDEKEQTEILTEVNRRIEMCNNAIALTKTPLRKFEINNKIQYLNVVDLDSNVNSLQDDYSGIILPTDSMLIFTSRRVGSSLNKTDWYDEKFKEDVYYSVIRNDGWEPAQRMNELINTNDHEAVNFISADGKKVYIYRGKDLGTIYTTTFENNAWTKPLKLDKSDKINVGSWETSTYITDGDKKIYFVSNRKGGFGGRDIYVSTKTADGSWGDPENLGPSVNTAYDEDAPFLSQDGQLLYFSSTGHNSMGGFDIFKSKLTDNKWAAPQNMGYPINSEGDDIYFIINFKNDKCFYSSSRNRKNNYSDLDIYEINYNCKNLPLTIVKGICNDTTLRIQVTNPLGKSKVLITSPKADGSYALELSPETAYNFKFVLDKNTSFDTTVFIPKQCDAYDLFQKISLTKTTDANTGKTTAGMYVQNAFYDIAALTSGTEGKDQLNIYSNYLTTPESKTQDNYSELKKDFVLTSSTDVIPKTVFFKNVLFDFDKSAIRTVHKHELDSLADYMSKKPNIKIELGGHTDSKGSGNYNQLLSEKRSAAVKNYLIKKGVNENRISIQYFGETKPFVPNTNITNRQLNRRVEILIVK